MAVFLPVTGAPVSTGTPSILAENWLREANGRLGKTLPRNLSTEIPYYAPDGSLLFYAVQLEPQGLIIVSANDLIEPVIAFSDIGTTNDLTTGHPLMDMLTTDMPDRNREALNADVAYAAISTKASAQAEPTQRQKHALANKAKWEKYAAPVKSATPTKGVPTPVTAFAAVSDSETTEAPSYSGTGSISDIRVAPMLQSTWNQARVSGAACFNYYCPPYAVGNANNYPAGCVATVMAQLMRYWQYPGSDIGIISNDITVMGTSKTVTTLGGDGQGGAYDWSNMPLKPSSGTTDAQRQAIGRLLADCGTVVNMSYASGGSSATLSAARNALISVFHYGNAKYRYVSGGVSKSEREAILFSNLSAGYPVITGIRNSSSGHAVITDGFGYISSTPYFHINYGWSGFYDAWYNMPTLDSAPAYDIVDTLVYNIFPAGTGELISGRVVDALGVAIPNATVTATSPDTSLTTTTDANGYYGLCLPGGTYSLSVTKANFTPPDPITSLTITNSRSYSDINRNYWGANITMTSDLESIPTLSEWGLISLGAFIVYFGVHSLKNQENTNKWEVS